MRLAMILILLVAAMAGCIGPDDSDMPASEPERFTARLLLLDGEISEEGRPYQIEGFCGMSLPVYAADVAGRQLWLVGGMTNVHSNDSIVAWVDSTVRYMEDNGCEQTPAFFGGDNAVATHTDPAGDRVWTVHLGEPPALRDPPSSTDIVLAQPYSVELARPHEWSPSFRNDRNGTYWYNGTLTWEDLGEWQVFLEHSWCDVPEQWRRLSCS